jgi:hypothetical protein
VDEWQTQRLADTELHNFFDRLFPNGWSGADVLAEIAPDGWERTPLLACFHPSVERLFEERVSLQRNLDELRRMRWRADAETQDISWPEPTLDDVRREYEPSAVNTEEEVTELVGLCLWDVFSDNHEVVAADGRMVDIGSFRGQGRFWTNTWRATVTVGERATICGSIWEPSGYQDVPISLPSTP